MEAALLCRGCSRKFTSTDRRPRNLNCGHSFCTCCCEKLVNQPPVKCYLCEMEQETVKDVNDIPISVLIEDIIQIIDAPEPIKEKKKKPSCKICFNAFNMTDRRPRNLDCGHSYCTLCCTELVMQQQGQCPNNCRKQSDKTVNDANAIPIAIQVEEIIQAFNEHEHSDEEKAATEFCEEHGVKCLFFCESHDKFICHVCFIVEHNKGNCKIVDKNRGLEKIVQACHVGIELEKKEFISFKSKLDKYISILRKEEEVHSKLQDRLSELASKHEEKRTYLESERIKVEHFLEEQETTLNISLSNIQRVDSIPEASELIHATNNVIQKTENERIAEEKRCYESKHLDTSIEARKSTHKEIKALTDTHEVEKLVSELKSGYLRRLDMESTGLLLSAAAIVCWKEGSQGLLEICTYCVVPLVATHYGFNWILSKQHRGIVFYVARFTAMVTERHCALYSSIVICATVMVYTGRSDYVFDMTYTSLLVRTQLRSREEWDTLVHWDTAAWGVAVLAYFALVKWSGNPIDLSFAAMISLTTMIVPAVRSWRKVNNSPAAELEN